MKKLLVILIGFIGLLPQPVSAATSVDITITAVGIVIGAPGGFTLTYISDYEVGIDWTKADGAVNTMIRAAVGRYPTSITDGYLVYYGDGVTTSDTGVSLDETAAAVYYRAWSENADHVFSPVWAEGKMEGIGVVILGIAALMLVGLAALAVAWFNKTMIFAVIGIFVFMMTGFFAYTRIATDGQLFWGFFFGCFGMMMMAAIEIMMLREPKPQANIVGFDDPFADDPVSKAWEESRQNYRKRVSSERMSKSRREDIKGRAAVRATTAQIRRHG